MNKTFFAQFLWATVSGEGLNSFKKKLLKWSTFDLFGSNTVLKTKSKGVDKVRITNLTSFT